MLKKTITYSDCDGNKLTEDFYFNLNKAELGELQIKYPGGYDKFLEKVIEEQDQSAMFDIFKDIILMSYGVRSADGKSFRKSQEVKDDFYYSDAYSELFMDLCSGPDKVEEFMEGILPDLDKEQLAAAKKDFETRMVNK